MKLISRKEKISWNTSSFRLSGRWFGLVSAKKPPTKADVDAILKRATFLVNTKNFVYYRKAGINEEHVPRKFMVNADYLTDKGKKWYGQFKDNKKGMPADFEIEAEKEQTSLRLMYKNIAQSRQPDSAHRQTVRGLCESER